MILVDTSVWIDKLAGRETVQTLRLERLLIDQLEVGLGDLVMMEVLQGTRDLRALALARAQLSEFTPVLISDHTVADMAARNYQFLRALGVTVRKTIDTLIATRCILDNIPLLYSDRDFDPFVQHLGLRSALDASGVH